jgi:hypothetical protein
LESVCRGNSTVGSNPTLSAIRLRISRTSHSQQSNRTVSGVAAGRVIRDARRVNRARSGADSPAGRRAGKGGKRRDAPVG